MKEKEKLEAIRLRTEGKSLLQISKELKVSKSSASVWSRDVILTDEQRKNLHDYRNWCLGQQIFAKQCAKKREMWRQEGRQKAQDKTDWLYLAGCMLYWGEGKKERNCVGLANTDPNLVRFFVKFLKHIGTNINDIVVNIRYYSSSQKKHDELSEFWTTKLELPKSCIRSIKEDCDKRIRTGKRKNIHPYGICAVILTSTEIQQKILGAIEEYGETVIKDESSKRSRSSTEEYLLDTQKTEARLLSGPPKIIPRSPN